MNAYSEIHLEIILRLGRMAEWSCRGLQILQYRFDSGFGLHLLFSFLTSRPFLLRVHEDSFHLDSVLS